MVPPQLLPQPGESLWRYGADLHCGFREGDKTDGLALNVCLRKWQNLGISFRETSRCGNTVLERSGEREPCEGAASRGEREGRLGLYRRDEVEARVRDVEAIRMLLLLCPLRIFYPLSYIFVLNYLHSSPIMPFFALYI